MEVSKAAEFAQRFGWPEYLVFGLMLAVSAGIGIFFGFFGKRDNSTSEFLMGSRKMGTFPVAMSLLASFMSAVTLLGAPVEMYNYGTEYWMIGISFFLVIPATAYWYLPIFHRLRLTSVYEYLERRFHKSIRIMGSAIFTTQMTIYLAIVVYAPALALSQVTGMDIYLCVGIIFAVCIFYTTLGGMKAVMWTDTFQVGIIFLSMLAVIVKGTFDVGGSPAVFQRNWESGRINFFTFDLDPTVRHTFWSLVIGGYFTWVSIYGVNQTQVQRYLSVATVKQAQKTVCINLTGLFILLTITCYGGLVIIYAKYYNCDPLRAGLVTTQDQLFPLFVMDTLGDIPGLPGFFVAGIFSGALSTLSSGLNSLAAISLEDFVKSIYRKEISDRTCKRISQGLSVLFGLVCFGLVFVAEQLGGVLQATLSIFGMISGPLLGIFSLGIFFPWANSKGAAVGTISGLAFIFWIGIGANISVNNKSIIISKMPLSIDGCDFNVTAKPPIITPIGDALPIYRLSYMWYSATGCLTVIFVGLIVSFLTGAQDPKELDPNLLCHVGERLCCCFPRRWCSYIREVYAGNQWEEKRRELDRSRPYANDVEIIRKGYWAFEKDGKKNGMFVINGNDNTCL